MPPESDKESPAAGLGEVWSAGRLYGSGQPWFVGGAFRGGLMKFPIKFGAHPLICTHSQGRQAGAGNSATYGQLGPGNSVFCHGASTKMYWRGRACTRTFHVHRTQLLPSADVGWEGTHVDWNGEGWVEDKEISRRDGRGIPSVQTALISLK